MEVEPDRRSRMGAGGVLGGWLQAPVQTTATRRRPVSQVCARVLRPAVGLADRR